MINKSAPCACSKSDNAVLEILKLLCDFLRISGFSCYDNYLKRHKLHFYLYFFITSYQHEISDANSKDAVLTSTDCWGSALSQICAIYLISNLERFGATWAVLFPLFWFNVCWPHRPNANQLFSFFFLKTKASRIEKEWHIQWTTFVSPASGSCENGKRLCTRS